VIFRSSVPKKIVIPVAQISGSPPIVIGNVAIVPLAQTLQRAGDRAAQLEAVSELVAPSAQ
jgi:hypothetical protein